MPDGEIKTEISKDENANLVTNPIFVELSDGTNSLSVTGGILDVNATVVLDTAYTDGSTDFTVQVSEVNAQGFLVDDTATDAVAEGEIGLARMTTDRIMITDAQQRGTWTIDSITNDVTVDATDLDIRDLVHTQDSIALGDGTGVLVDVLDSTIDALQVAISDGTDQMGVNADGSINVVVSGSAGTPVADYDTAASVAKDATDNHDYTVVGSVFNLERVSFGGSGRMKVEIQAGPLASLVTKAVRFTKRDTSDDQVFSPAFPVLVASTGTVRVIRTQRSVGSLDVYSTIMGLDVA